MITLVLPPAHLPLSLDQTCFITWSHLFYFQSTFHNHLIKLVLSPDYICFITEHLLLPLVKLVLLPDHIYFITRALSYTTWSNLFYYLITFVLLPDHIFFYHRAPFITTWSNWFYHLTIVVLLPKHLPSPLDQTCFITDYFCFTTLSYLFYHWSTVRYLLMKPVFFYLITFVLSPQHLSLPLDLIGFIT